MSGASFLTRFANRKGTRGEMSQSAARLSRCWPKVTALAVALLVLSACTTGKSPDSKLASTAQDKSRSATSNDYVDPAVVSASTLARTRDRAAGDETRPSRVPDPNTPGNAMEQGVITQPTGIRASSVSIFSHATTTPVQPDPGDIPDSANHTGRVNARTGSVFSAPTVRQGCSTQSEGNMLSC